MNRKETLGTETIVCFACVCINTFYSLPDVRYSYVVDQQPIGRLLFRQFCECVKPMYHKYNKFLDDVVSPAAPLYLRHRLECMLFNLREVK